MLSPTDALSRDSGSVTRADLADAVLRRVGLSRAESADIVDAVLRQIIDVIVSGEDLKLHSFGSFHVRRRTNVLDAIQRPEWPQRSRRGAS